MVWAGCTWWLMCRDAMGSTAAPEGAGALTRSALLTLCARAMGSASAADDVGDADAGLCAPTFQLRSRTAIVMQC